MMIAGEYNLREAKDYLAKRIDLLRDGDDFFFGECGLDKSGVFAKISEQNMAFLIFRLIKKTHPNSYVEFLEELLNSFKAIKETEEKDKVKNI